MKLYKLLEVMDRNSVVITMKGEIIKDITFDIEEKEIKEVKALEYVTEIVLHHEKYHKRRYRELKQKGLCPKCGMHNDTNRTYCSKCEKTNYISKGLMFEYREMSGRCKTCGDTLTKQDKKQGGGYFKNCQKCRDHMKNKNNRNIAKRKEENK